MIKVLFVCHGNICRSPMAEFVLKDMVQKLGYGDQFEIASAATSTEEIGNPVHPGTRNKLWECGISCTGKTAVQLRKSDYDYYDYLIGMDTANIRNMEKITGHRGGKICLLLEFAGSRDSISDPWYTGDFESTYLDVMKGCKGLLHQLMKNASL
jgi:protein-tyrosine phosphatase